MLPSVVSPFSRLFRSSCRSGRSGLAIATVGLGAALSFGCSIATDDPTGATGGTSTAGVSTGGVSTGTGGVSTGTAVAAGFAGLAAGAMIGSAVARANQPTYVVAPTAVYPAPYYAAPPVVVPLAAAIGTIYYSLPLGARSANINGTQYYVLGNTYYRPYFGSNGVYYEVVANPI